MKFIKTRWDSFVNAEAMSSFHVEPNLEADEMLVTCYAGTDEYELYAVPYTNRAEELAAKAACDLWLDDLIKELKGE